MRSLLVSSAVVLLATAGVTLGADKKIKSGLQPGDSAGAFNVLDCSGPNKGKKLCYR